MPRCPDNICDGTGWVMVLEFIRSGYRSYVPKEVHLSRIFELIEKGETCEDRDDYMFGRKIQQVSMRCKCREKDIKESFLKACKKDKTLDPENFFGWCKDKRITFYQDKYPEGQIILPARVTNYTDDLFRQYCEGHHNLISKRQHELTD